MGVSGTGIFADDNAADLREDYRDFLRLGLTGAEATDRLLNEWAPQGDPDLEPVFWLALAVTQWKAGRLEPRVKEAALRVIEDGSAIKPWLGSQFETKRKGVLEKVRVQLEQPQPGPTQIRKLVLATCDWQRGELIAYRLRSGKFIVFRMLDVYKERSGAYPECELFDWQGTEVPREGLPPSTPILKAVQYGPSERMMLIPLGKTKLRQKLEREGRLAPIGVRHELEETYSRRVAGRVLSTRIISDLDPQLEEYFGLGESKP